MLAGRVFNPRSIDEVDVTARFPASYGQGRWRHAHHRAANRAPGQQRLGAQLGARPRGREIKVRIVGVGRSPWFSDSVGSFGAVQVTPALLAHYRANLLGSHHRGYINALVRLKGGEAAIPRFRTDLARVSGRSDIDVWDNLVNFGDPTRRTTYYEAACLFAFGLAALAAALFLVGQSVARYTAASVADLQLLRAPGITPREATLAAPAPARSWPRWRAPRSASARRSWRRNWMPIGAASLLEPRPGDQRRLADPRHWVGPRPGPRAARIGRGRLRRRRRQPRAASPAPVTARGCRGQRRGPGTGAGRCPLRARAGTWSSALPVRPALVGAIAGVLGVLAAFTFSAGVSDAAANPARFGQTDQLQAFVGLNGRDFGPVLRRLRACAGSEPRRHGLNDARSAVAQSGRVSITTYTYAPVGGKRMPSRPDRRPHADRPRTRSCSRLPLPSCSCTRPQGRRTSRSPAGNTPVTGHR